jgi:hypothetical protein
MLSEQGGPAYRADDAGAPDDFHWEPYPAGWSTILYFYPSNLDTLHQELFQRGFTVSSKRTTAYGMQEFRMRDPDGHILWFGTELS